MRHLDIPDEYRYDNEPDREPPRWPPCEKDGEIIDTYGAEHYWQCGLPGTVTVPSGRRLCEDHAGELGYGPRQAYYGFDPDDGHEREPGEPCPACGGTGTITVPDRDGESASEYACPDPAHKASR